MKQKSVKNKNVIVHNDRGDSVRLNKYISESGFCSRREADKLIQSGLVTIDGVKAEMGTKVTKGQKVRVNGILISKEEELVYIALNKPVGITCTTEHKVKGNIVDFVNHKKRIFPIGRLDKDSQGLILMTNDGDIVNKILRAGNNYTICMVLNMEAKGTELQSDGIDEGYDCVEGKDVPIEVILKKEGENYVIKEVKEYTSLEEAQNENEGFKKNK